MIEGWHFSTSAAAAVRREPQAGWHYCHSAVAVVDETAPAAALVDVDVVAAAAGDLETLSIQNQKEYYSPATDAAGSAIVHPLFAYDLLQPFDAAAVLVRVGFGGSVVLGAHYPRPVFGGAVVVVQVGTFVVGGTPVDDPAVVPEATAVVAAAAAVGYAAWADYYCASAAVGYAAWADYYCASAAAASAAACGYCHCYCGDEALGCSHYRSQQLVVPRMRTRNQIPRGYWHLYFRRHRCSCIAPTRSRKKQTKRNLLLQAPFVAYSWYLRHHSSIAMIVYETRYLRSCYCFHQQS